MAKYVDKFCLNEQIEKNEYSKTYKGVDRNTGQEVVIKVFSLQSIDQNKIYHQKILNEMTIIEATESEYIVKPISYLKTSNNMYHVYERFNEGTLPEYMDRFGKIPEAKSLEFFRMMVQCVNDIHINNILHRDLCPSSFIFKNGKICITNFFNAIMINNTEIENDEVISKNHNYRAPENLKQNYNYTKKSDMYSLGVILYKMIYGEFPNRNNIRVKHDHINAEYFNLLTKLLEDDPNLRLSSTEALYYIDNNLSKRLNEHKFDANNRIKNGFNNFRNKMDFLIRLGNYLYLNNNIGETVSMAHYLVMKKTYLLTKAFKDFFVSLKKNADSSITWQAYEEFLKGIERESLTHLISFQNTLSNSIDSSKYYDLSKDIESLDNFANFEHLCETIIIPLIEKCDGNSLDKIGHDLFSTFVKNEKAQIFTDFDKPLIGSDN